MHWIARHILKILTFSDAARYRELLPDGVEGNLFQYHARKLERAGLIEREKDGYRLSDKGRQAVADMNLIRDTAVAATPRAVAMIYARLATGETLLFRWRRHPYRNYVSLPFGRITYGKTAAQMADEQLYCKTGYRAVFTFMGSVHLRLMGEESFRDHLLIQVFEATELTRTHDSDGLTGDSLWGNPEDPELKLLPGTREILEWIHAPGRPGLLEIEV